MKKLIALFLSIILTMSMFAPVLSYAQSDKELEQAITIVREKFNIPDDFEEFNYSMSTEGDRKIWYMRWSSKDNLKGSMNARIDNKGTIISYNYNKPYNNDNQGKLPKITKQEAKVIAEEFIKKINPDYLNQIRYQDNNQISIMDSNYYLNYIRVINNIPFYQNDINVRINRQTGEVESYRCNWLEDVEFVKPDNIISLEDAQKAYKEKLGLELIYKYTYEDKKLNTYLVYTPIYNNNYNIDAFTGEKIDFSSDDGIYYRDADAMIERENLAKASAGGSSPQQIVLSPEEQKAVREVSDLLSQDEAEKKARDFKYLEITSDYKVTNASLSKEYMDETKFVWSISFSNRDASKETTVTNNDSNKNYRTVSVSMNAETGDIKDFYISTVNNQDDKVKFDKADAKAKVEDFLKDFKPDIFSQTIFDDKELPPYEIVTGNEKPKYFNFRYNRMVNDIPFYDNGIQVRFNTVTGKITSLNINWFDTEFASVDEVMDLEKIYEKMFANIGLELQYKSKYPDNNRIATSGAKPEIKLVYTVKPEIPVIFEANTGTILDYNGKPFIQQKPNEYTDITGHFAEQYINTLAELGIALEGTEFKPDENITQLDFFTLLSKTLNYYQPYPVAENKNKEIEQLYTFLIREGIVKENEKAPDSQITREETVKYIIRALKFDKVADIKEIYNCPFKDKEQINPVLVGYVTIAGGLGIINLNSESFNPKGNLTRAQAAVVIYNYLQN